MGYTEEEKEAPSATISEENPPGPSVLVFFKCILKVGRLACIQSSFFFISDAVKKRAHIQFYSHWVRLIFLLLLLMLVIHFVSIPQAESSGFPE